jgi:hypothetical protein
MGFRTRGALFVLVSSSLGFGIQGSGKRAAGTGPYEEDDECPHCGGVLKVNDGALSCKSCLKSPGED